MSKTLVIILSETRAHELTFDSFKKNVIDELNADLCVCIGVKPDYDYNNPFYKLAKYKFTYNEPNDYGDALDYAYNILSKDKSKYEKLDNFNALYGKLQNPKQSTDNITYYGKTDDIKNIEEFDDDEIIIHQKNFKDTLWQDQVYEIKKSNKNNLIKQDQIITYRKQLYWREFLKLRDQFLGGIKDRQYQHPGSAGILIFFRWFLLKNLIDSDLINKYDRFIITRSDFIYRLPHPKIDIIDEHFIWIPDCEHYGGYTDRHVVLSRTNIEQYLNIFNNFVIRSNEYFDKMMHYNEWNLERLIKFHFLQNNVLHLVKEFPYVMYSVRNINGSTRWMGGNYSSVLGYYIKYQTEYDKSQYYKNIFDKSNLTINEFYKKYTTSDNLDLGWCQGYMGLKYHMEEALLERKLNRNYATVAPQFAIFSHKYYNEINELEHNKIYDYCFIGSIKSNYQTRKWIIDFAKKYFTTNSIFINTDIKYDNKNTWELLGPFDYSNMNMGYCPKNEPDNQAKNVQYRVVKENIEYFERMCQSKFILCPAGDSSWSFRFYEVIMCKSIPIVESWHHTYRTKEESKLKYKYILYKNIDNEIIYEDYINDNTKIFEKYHMIN